MTFTAEDLKNELNSDGLTVDGEAIYSARELYWEARPGETLNTLALGDFKVFESVVGKEGEIDFDRGCNVWRNYIILKQGDRYFELPGEYDSWDAQGWTGEVVEVQPVEKTITVWGKKNV